MPHKAFQHIVKERRITADDVVSLSVIAAVFIAFLFSGYSVVSNINRSNETHTALCVLKYDIIERRDNTAGILREHEGKDPVFGIPRATLEESVRSQTRTIAALRLLSCPQDDQTAGLKE